MLVRHFMTTDLYTLGPESLCGEVLREFRRRRVRRAPVVEKGQLVGIVSERDLLRVLPGTPAQASTCAGEDCLDLPVRRIMHAPVVTLKLNDPLATAAKLMLAHRIGGLPVVHQGGVKGIITESDIFKALFGILSAEGGGTLLLEEPAGAAEGIDYGRLCQRYAVRIRTLLRYPKPEGGAVVHLGFAGGDVEGLRAGLSAAACRVILIEK